MKIGNFRVSKKLLWVATGLLTFFLTFLPGATAHANSYGQQIVIYFSDGGTTTITSDGTDICTQVNALYWASNCDYPDNVHDMGYVNGVHYVYAVRNGSGGSHQPVVTHPRTHPVPHTGYPQTTGHVGGSTVVIDGVEYYNVQVDACQFMRSRGYQHCYYNHERSDTHNGYHVLSSTPLNNRGRGGVTIQLHLPF